MAMARRSLVLMGVCVVVLWVFPADIFAGDVQSSADKSKMEKQAQQQGKQSKEADIRSRGLFSQKKKKKTDGGAAARSQPSDRTDPPTDNPAGHAMP
jgi:hypothetical protein